MFLQKIKSKSRESESNQRHEEISRNHYSPPLYQLSYHGQHLLTHYSRSARCYQPTMSAYGPIRRPELYRDQRRTGFNNRPGQFPDYLPPYRPSPGKITKNSEITIFPFKNYRFLLHLYRPTGHCPNASMASPHLIVTITIYFMTKTQSR